MKAIFLTVALVANFAFASNAAERDLLVEVISHKSNVVAVHYEMPIEGLVRISIIDPKTKEVLFTETQTHHKVAVIKFDMSHLPAGNYVVEVKQGAETVTKTVSVK